MWGKLICYLLIHFVNTSYTAWFVIICRKVSLVLQSKVIKNVLTENGVIPAYTILTLFKAMVFLSNLATNPAFTYAWAFWKWGDFIFNNDEQGSYKTTTIRKRSKKKIIKRRYWLTWVSVPSFLNKLFNNTIQRVAILTNGKLNRLVSKKKENEQIAVLTANWSFFLVWTTI